MKFTLTIADDQRPEGWNENYAVASRSIEDAQRYAEELVKTFNEQLRPGERPRRLLSVKIAHPRQMFCWREFQFEGVTYRAELRADGLHLRRKHSPKFTVLPLQDALMAVNGQALLRLK